MFFKHILYKGVHLHCTCNTSDPRLKISILASMLFDFWRMFYIFIQNKYHIYIFKIYDILQMYTQQIRDVLRTSWRRLLYVKRTQGFPQRVLWRSYCVLYKDHECEKTYTESNLVWRIIGAFIHNDFKWELNNTYKRCDLIS